LKTITFISKRKFIIRKISLLLLLLVFSNNVLAQVQNNGSIYVDNSAYMYLESDSFNFGVATATTQTTRTKATYGKIIYQSGVTHTGVSNAHFTNGYVRTLSASQFVFPIGQTGVYAPAAVDAVSTGGVDAAYYKSNAATIGASLDASETVNGTLGPNIVALSTQEYWHVQGVDAKLTLTWRSSSDLTTLVLSALDNLTIAGWDKAADEWVEIPSTYDNTSILGGASTITAGSITSTADVVLSNFTAFTLAYKSECAPLVANSGFTRTWDGTTWDTVPTLNDNVVIDSATPSSPGSFQCNNLTLNADISLANGEYIEVVNDVTNNSSKIIMASTASFVQRKTTGTAAPSIELTKQTRNLHRYDYVYWGTPISGNFFSQLAAAKATTVVTTGAFDLKYYWLAGTTWGWQTLSAITTGKGYIMRVAPVAPFTSSTAQDKIDLKFTGTANNGDIPVNGANFGYNATYPNGSSSHNLLANPYPCALDGNMFLRFNPNIDGVIYVWQQETNSGTLQVANSQADYLAYTLAGFTVTNPGIGTFIGNIASGQGFQVKALNSNGVTFTNCMRLTGNNTSFFRTNNNATTTTQPIDRFKLTMTGANNVYSQILIAYTPNATLGYDRLYDAGRNSVSTAQLYSVFEGDGRKLAINARPPFDNTDIVPIGVSKNNTTSEMFSINIEQKEGLFNAGQNVYLHDKVLDVYHDFTNGSYSFASNSTTLNTRFDVVYQASALGNDQFDNTAAIATINNSELTVHASIEMKSVELFDITGKLLGSYKVESNKEFKTPFHHAEGVYIAKIKLTTGELVTQKLINIHN